MKNVLNRTNIKVGITGNLDGVYFSILRKKGFAIEVIRLKDPKSTSQTINARKEGLLFNADSFGELLGLIHMWEVRGDDWYPKKEDSASYKKVMYEDIVSYDEDGNLVEDE